MLTAPAIIAVMDIRIAPAGVADFHRVLTDHPRHWGERDLRSLHLLALVREFGSTCLVARAEDGIRGYVFGFVTPDGTGYVHLIAPGTTPVAPVSGAVSTRRSPKQRNAMAHSG